MRNVGQMRLTRPTLSRRALVAVALWTSLIGFAASAVMGEWLYDANRVGYVPLPPRLASVSIWAGVIVATAIAVFLWKGKRSLLLRQTARITVPLALYATATGISVVIAAVRFGPQFGIRTLPALLLTFAPLAVIILLSHVSKPRADIGTPPWTLMVVVSLAAFESVFALIQWPQLQSGSVNWFTIGSETRWWDSRAAFGTFATTGSHFFADAMVLFGAVILPWALFGRLRRGWSLLLLGLCFAIAAIVLFSLVRAALLSLVLAAAVTVLDRRSVKAFVGGGLLLAAFLWIVPPTHASLNQLIQRGIFDAGVSLRLQVWSELATHPRGQWLIGEGANSIGLVTRQIGINVPHSGDPNLGPTTDNLYLRLIVEAGVLGLGTFLLLLLGIGLESNRKSPTFEGALWRRALRGFAVALAVQSLSSDTIINPEVAAIFALCLGAVAAGLLAEYTHAARRKLAVSQLQQSAGQPLQRSAHQPEYESAPGGLT